MKKGKITLILVLILLTMVQNSTNSIASESKQSVNSIKGITAYVERGPIEILNDSAFGPSGYNFTGTGTFNDPYLIENYNITASSGSLIHIENTTKHFKIRNSYFNNTGVTPYLSSITLINVQYGTLMNNTIFDNYVGIGSVKVNNTLISNNTIYNCSYGIILMNSYHNTISNNTVYDIETSGIAMVVCDDNTVIDNTVYLVDSSAGISLFSAKRNNVLDNIISEVPDGIQIVNSSNSNTINYNSISMCENGIYISTGDELSCINNFIYGNIIHLMTVRGIYLQHAINTTISRNSIYDGTMFGITLFQSNYTTIVYNNIYANDEEGLMFQVSSDNNTVHWNNFIDNYPTGSSQAYDECTKNNVTFNYWDDYVGPGNYSIAGISLNNDSSPLANPVSPLVTIDSPLNTYYSTNNIAVELSGSCTHYWFYLAGIDGMNQTWKSDSSIAYSLSDGTYTLHAFGNDTLGNNGSTSVTFVIDTVSPTVDITNPTSTTYNKSNVTLIYSTSDGVVTVYIDGVANTTAHQSGSFVLGLTEGVHNITITAIDQAGNWDIDTVIFTIDTTIDTTTTTGATSFPGLFTILIFCITLVAVIRRHEKG